MVKPDIKHNYYADLELPSTASIDDIRKAYRKLALQYHPDRNSGREAECVPKFQAIQAAHEVLGDLSMKAKYDQDRRKADLRPMPKPGFNAPGNPYSKSSNFPPPPRRTQPGSWQRPTPTASAAPSGADRFTNFPRPNNTTPRKDPNTERAQQFRAWQRMNNGAERPRNNYDGGPPSPPPQPSTARPRPPRQDTKMPSEEQIRAGMNYRSVPGYNHRDGERRPSARNIFEPVQSYEPGIKRSNTFRTPRKPGGFDPSAPGSDERPAPAGGNSYGHRHRSEDLGTPASGPAFPPPPPRPPPTQPSSRRPSVDPSNSDRNTHMNDDNDGGVPYYATESRTSTPYTAFSGEKTRFSSDNLRRSASTRDATKLQADEDGRSRARSTSPMNRQKAAGNTTPNGGRNTFSSEHRQGDGPHEPPMQNNDTSAQGPTTSDGDPNLAEEPVPADRPKKKPVPRIRRYNSSATSSAQPDLNGSAESVQPDGSIPSMQQRPSSQNMYADPHFFQTPQFRNFNPSRWAATAFGSHPASGRERKIPQWAIPSSVCPQPQSQRPSVFPRHISRSGDASSESNNSSADDGAPELMAEDERKAFTHFCHEIKDALGGHAVGLEERQFLRLVSNARKGHLPQYPLLRLCLLDTFARHPSLCPNYPDLFADTILPNGSFTFPIYADTFASNVSKSRSEENISTNFSPDGWSGTFTGAPVVSTPPATGRKPSPALRPSQRPLQRTPTAERGYSNATPLSNMPPPPRPADLNSTQQQQSQTNIPNEVKFSKVEWEKTFQDPSWTWPPPPPNPPPKMKEPTESSSTERRFEGQAACDAVPERTASNGTKDNPHIVDDGPGENVRARATQIEDDAMDIDSTPPPTVPVESSVHSQATPTKEPRLYSVPPSSWRQQQGASLKEPSAHQPGHTAAASGLKADLNDLSQVEPLKQGAEGLASLTTLQSNLPFQSKASDNPPTHQSASQTPEISSVPKAPEAPHRLNKSSWHGYCVAFGGYLQAFHAFNRAMLAHFENRERTAQAQMLVGMGWLEATGDTVGQAGGPSGFGSYLKGVREDEHVREVWNVGVERHAEAVKEFEKHREHIRRLARTGALSDR